MVRVVAAADGCRWITPEWPAPAWVRAVSTLRSGGSSRAPYASLNLGAHVGDDPAAVAENRRALQLAVGLPQTPEWLTQVHGTQIRDLDVGVDAREGADPVAVGPADGAVARSQGTVCAILTADCLPVIFTSEAGDRVGAAHAGWRGLAFGVLEATVAALGCTPGTLLAWLGPAIGPCEFEVGAEVRDAFLRAPGAGAADDAAFVPSTRAVNARGGDARGMGVPSRYLADLYALARCRLARLGVRRVYGGGECTFTAADRYFSHRRDGLTGRQATLIWLEAVERR